MAHQPILIADGFLFPEAPRWHHRRGCFLISDIDRGQVIEVTPAGERRLAYQAPGWVSGTAFDGDDTLIVTHARERKLVRIDLTTSVAAPYADLTDVAGFAINDMIRAKTGHCFVNTVNFDFLAYTRGEAASRPSPLVCVAPSGKATIATRDVNFSNGMAISPDGQTLYVADSLDACIYGFPLDSDGRLGARFQFANMPGEMPDGIALDASGAIWVATHHRVIRVARGGEILEVVDMGTTRATACALGGHDGRTLLITASDSHDRTVISQNPSGRIFRVDVAVAGAGLPSIYEGEST